MVENEADANTVSALLSRTDAKVKIIDVPVWPDLKAEE